MKVLKRIAQYGSAFTRSEDICESTRKFRFSIISLAELKDDIALKNDLSVLQSEVRDKAMSSFIQEFSITLQV